MTISLAKKPMIDLQKQASISLEKRGASNILANVVLALDISPSMSNLYSTGVVQMAVERVLALASKFDADQKVDIFVFDQGARYVGTVDMNQIQGWVAQNIQRLGSGTNYGPVINQITTKYANKHKTSTQEILVSNGFMGLGKKTRQVVIKTPVPVAVPTYVLFATDGDNFDPSEATQAVVEASQHGIFWQFVGLGNQRFDFLRKLDNLEGRFLDNANFFQLDGEVNDADLYDKLLAEFPSWIDAARSKGLIT